ncbi:uncharacterized protein LOC128960189 [Oppia nitens]|uniref:uncharacterized protein LOC128960189 n=1 Tax=Oppia nitens TaxID=1686743 RepID=UPI0023DC59F5|nr:uncharacterized protein LOC128960189 [Oppia nitens]
MTDVVGHFSKQAQKTYTDIVHKAEGLKKEVINKAMSVVCDKGAQGIQTLFKSLKCDPQHSEVEFCKHAPTAEAVFTLLCETLKEKAEEFVTILFSCFKAPKPKQLDCVSMLYEEAKKTADQMKGLANAGRK